ncbi:MAG: leucine-rich repeat domain-containing protein, partial [Alloprevotella sp.]|nr:leucine-rich repeat domain-containing protein [Alloprevotella sp.]
MELMGTYKRLTLALGLALAAGMAAAQQRVVEVTTPGSLPTLITESEKYTITDLKVTGEINGTDVTLLRDMGGAKNINTKTDGQLQRLDLSEARIVAGGDAYFNWAGMAFRTADDVMGSYMFLYASKIKSLKLPPAITAIGDQVFGSLVDLEEIEIPAGVKSIGVGCFINCNTIKSITLPDAVETLGTGCFQRMESLREVYFGDGLRELDNSVFLNDNALEKVHLGRNLQTFHPVVFYTLPAFHDFSCSEESPYYKAVDGVLMSRDGGTLVSYPCAREETTYEIPAGVHALGSHAFCNATSLERMTVPAGVEAVSEACFDGCQSLTEVTLGDGVKTICEGAFSGCIALERLSLPRTVETVEGGAFLECISLTDITVDASSQNLKVEDGALLSRDGGRLICLPAGLSGADYVLPTSVHTLEPYSMATHSTLREVYIPEHVTTVGDNAFYACEQLEECVFSEKVETIGETVFYGSDKMDRVYFLSTTPPA